MTHILLLLRHAQSADKQPGQTDWQRILNREGEGEATRIGNFLKTHAQIPDLVITSTATRALQTASTVCNQIGYQESLIQKSEVLYEAHATQFLTIINSISSGVQCVLLVAHNPGISRAVEILTGQTTELRPCEMVRIEFNVPWQEITAQCGKLIEQLHPSTIIQTK